MTKEAFDKIAAGLNEALESVSLPASEETVPATDIDIINLNGKLKAGLTNLKTSDRFVIERCLHSLIARIRASDNENEILRFKLDQSVNMIQPMLVKRAEDAEAALRATREQAVRECAEIAREIATDVRNGSEARFQAGVLATRILSLTQVSAKK